jgi:hypothetical protein
MAPNHPKSASGRRCILLGVDRALLLALMVATVEFHDDVAVQQSEIENELADAIFELNGTAAQSASK